MKGSALAIPKDWRLWCFAKVMLLYYYKSTTVKCDALKRDTKLWDRVRPCVSGPREHLLIAWKSLEGGEHRWGGKRHRDSWDMFQLAWWRQLGPAARVESRRCSVNRRRWGEHMTTASIGSIFTVPPESVRRIPRNNRRENGCVLRGTESAELDGRAGKKRRMQSQCIASMLVTWFHRRFPVKLIFHNFFFLTQVKLLCEFRDFM